MPRYQLRIKAVQSLDDVLSELVESVWRFIVMRPEFSRLGMEGKNALKERLRNVFEKFVVRYDTCGLQVLCEEGLEPAEWNVHPDPDLQPRHPWQSEEVKRLAVNLTKGLEEFVDALEAEILKEIIHTAEQAYSAKALRGDFTLAIKETFGPHLYRNVACGLFELCQQAEKINPWQ